MVRAMSLACIRSAAKFFRYYGGVLKQEEHVSVRPAIGVCVFFGNWCLAMGKRQWVRVGRPPYSDLWGDEGTCLLSSRLLSQYGTR